MPKLVALIVTVASALALGGCGNEEAETGSSSAPIAAQVERFYAALAGGNGELACKVLTKQAAKGFEAVLNGPVSSRCETNVETLSRSSILRGTPRVTRVSVSGKQATAHVAFESPELESDVLLQREGGAWRLAQLPAVLQSEGAQANDPAE